MVHFEQTTATTWTAREHGRTVGTIKRIECGYDTEHLDGYRWTYDTLDAAQQSFLPE